MNAMTTEQTTMQQPLIFTTQATRVITQHLQILYHLNINIPVTKGLGMNNVLLIHVAILLNVLINRFLRINSLRNIFGLLLKK